MKRNIRQHLIFVASIAVIVGVVGLKLGAIERIASVFTPTASAACTSATLPTTYGVVSQPASVSTAGTYRVWSRIKVPDTSANSYYFSFDNGCAYTVGDLSSIPANTWTWVNYQDGSSSSPIDVTLSAGSHTFTYTGKEAGVQLDRIVLLVDKNCVPTGDGTNCAEVVTTPPPNPNPNPNPSPTPPPSSGNLSVSITAPANGAVVGTNAVVNIEATAAGSNINRVDFLVDGAVKNTDNSAPYTYPLNATVYTAGIHKLTAKVYDNTGATATSSEVQINIGGTATPPPATPTCTKAGDANCDGRVNAIDNSLIISNDGKTNFPAGDFNKDGVIGAADMAILIANWTW